MAQIANSSRLTNSAVNIIGATTANNTNYGVSRIGVTGNSFDISAFGSGNIVTLGATGTGNVTIGNGTSGTVTFPGVTTFTSAVNGGVFTGTSILGTTSSTALTIGSNLTTGSISLGVTGSNNTITIGNNGVGATGTVNVGSGSATVNVGTNAASAVVLGRTGGSVTLGPALTLGAAPTTSGHLGSIIGGSYITPDTPFSGAKDIATITIPVTGVYIIFFSMSINYSTPPTILILSFNGATSTALPVPSLICGLGAEIIGSAGSLTSSVPAKLTTAGTLVLKLDVTGTVNNISIASYSAMRIA